MVTWSQVAQTPGPIHVAFIAPPDEDGFWKDTQVFLQEVALDLNVEITFYPAMDHLEALQRLRDAAADSPKPNYAIFSQYFHMGERMLGLAQKENIRILIFNSTFNKVHKELVGRPREKYPNWLGHIFPDDKASGTQLANMLADEKKRISPASSPNKPMSILGVSGTSRTSPGVLRKKGLLEAIEGRNDLELKRAIYTEWGEDDAQRAMASLLEYYSNIDIIWAASERLAHGASRAVEEKGFVLGLDTLIGAIGWSGEALNDIKDGRINVALGGHLLEAGWALILLHDYHYGIDFKDDIGTVINLPMLALTKDNFGKYEQLISQRKWGAIDFRVYSKIYNTGLKKYDFSVDKLLELFVNAKSKPVNTNVLHLGKAVDKDQDDVIDVNDQCPSTAAHARVDFDGCEILPQKEPYIIFSSNIIRADVDAASNKFFVWENSMSERKAQNGGDGQVLSLRINGQGWFGAGIKTRFPTDLSNFTGAKSRLNFKIKVPDSISYRVGLIDGLQGSVWVDFPAGEKRFSQKTSDDWQKIEIPMSQLLSGPIELRSIYYVFAIASMVDQPHFSRRPFDIEIDDIFLVGEEIIDSDKDGINEANDVCPGSLGEVDGGGCTVEQRLGSKTNK